MGRCSCRKSRPLPHREGQSGWRCHRSCKRNHEKRCRSCYQRKETFKVDVTVDLTKEFGVEEVSVTVKDVNTDHYTGKVLQADFIRRLMEQAISKKASEIATRMAKNKTD